ncbi:MAG: L-aspartate oxidase [Clostridiales bacterium]
MNNRYLVNYDAGKLKNNYYDVIIIGSGIAGVYTALELDEGLNVAIITKEKIDISNSVLAQGGIAVSLDREDSPHLHFKDTINAGAGLCVEDSVWYLVNKAEKNIKSLFKYGVNFDKELEGELSLTREGAHSKNRIIHAGDTTGKEVCDKLISIVKSKENVQIFERRFVLDLIVDENQINGLIVYNEDNNSCSIFSSNIVICATGGYGQIYKNTTNPEIATGDGLAMAYRAGTPLMDLELVQFHPTVLYHEKNKSFLISEALRGEGAILKNIMGERFMPKYHELEELAPRDIVSRSIFSEMEKTNSKNVFLDVTFKGKKYLENRFPNIYKTCMDYGIDISKDLIPVCPAEHYCMGGIKADVNGHTNIKGFFVCGEVACNGIHGANRLASNSLLEGLVFGWKIGNEINSIIDNNIKNGLNDFFEKMGRKDYLDKYSFNCKREDKNLNINEMKNRIKEIMDKYVGIVRSQDGLSYAKNEIDKYYKMIINLENNSIAHFELQNIVLISRLVIESAMERKESRGVHYRSDFKKIDNKNWKRHIEKII